MATSVSKSKAAAAKPRVDVDEIRLQTGLWHTIESPTYGELSYRYVGQVTLSDGNRHTIVQRQERSYHGSHSYYKSQILYGNLVSEEEEASVISSGNRGIWCANCFKDDMYGNGEGDFQVPYWMRDRYFSRLQSLNIPCNCCGLQPSAFSIKQIVLPPTNGYLFRARSDPVIQAFIERELLRQFGIAPAKAFHDTENSMTKELQHDIVAEAMHPRRVAAYLDRGGFEALMETFA
jgi:hypothetical protein